MNTTKELLKDIDDVLGNENAPNEPNISRMPDTQEVINIIEEEMSDTNTQTVSNDDSNTSLSRASAEDTSVSQVESEMPIIKTCSSSDQRTNQLPATNLETFSDRTHEIDTSESINSTNKDVIQVPYSSTVENTSSNSLKENNTSTYSKPDLTMQNISDREKTFLDAEQPKQAAVPDNGSDMCKTKIELKTSESLQNSTEVPAVHAHRDVNTSNLTGTHLTVSSGDSEGVDKRVTGSSGDVNQLGDVTEPPQKRQRTDEESSEQQMQSIEVPMSDDTPMYTAKPAASTDVQALDESKSVLHCDDSLSTYSIYPFQGPPRQVTGAWQCFKSQSCNNYLRGVKWAPDGTCLMTNTNDNCIRLFNTPEQLYYAGADTCESEEMSPVLKVKEADTVYDYCWFSKMQSSDPDSACFAVTSKDTPVHLYDAFTGDLRCSYRAFDHVDELTAAYCLSFDASGSKLYCGFNKMIRVFDVSRPGRDCTSRPTYAKEGQSGIISCIAHSPTESGLYAAGSYSRSIALYQEPVGEMICMFEGQGGGVTHVMFSPDGSKLYSGGRKDNEILCWDLRNPGHILYTLERKVSTNQRIYFDITKDGRYVVSGCHDGGVRVWDTLEPPIQAEGLQEPYLRPIMSYEAHEDTVNGISLHPYLPVIVTSSGQRHQVNFYDSSDDDSSTEEQQNTIENSLRLWWIT